MGRPGVSKKCCTAIVNIYNRVGYGPTFDSSNIDDHARRSIGQLIGKGYLKKIQTGRYTMSSDGARYAKLAIGWGETGVLK